MRSPCRNPWGLSIILLAGSAFATGNDVDGPPAPGPPTPTTRPTRGKGDGRQTERAVADALAWLAAHQRSDGIWVRAGFESLCPPADRCTCAAVTRNSADADVAVTALALLAFLGAGHTHEAGPYSDNVERACEAILAHQTASGSFAPKSSLQLYNDAIATLAIAEAFVRTRDGVFAVPLERAVRHLERSQQAAGGWDYTADPRTQRNDTSVTGWVLMALKAAAAAGIPPSVETRWKLLAHFDRATETNGRVWYADAGGGVEVDPRTGLETRRYGPAMTALGLWSRATLGLRIDSPSARRQIDLLRGDLPRLETMQGRDPTGLHNEYYWYYGTLAMFNVGGEAWSEWNRALRNSILEYQEHPVRKDGTRGHAYGSWPAYGRGWGKWGRAGGRIYATAINALTLEVYYRHVPSFLSPGGLLGPVELRQRIASQVDADGQAAVRMARQFVPDTSEPVLVELLTHREAGVRLDAAIELAALGSPVGEAELRKQHDRAPPSKRERIDAALQRLAGRPKPAVFGRVSAVDEGAGMFLFDTGGQPVYYGAPVEVVRDGVRVATGRVDRRFSAEAAAAASVTTNDQPIATGDLVRPME